MKTVFSQKPQAQSYLEEVSPRHKRLQNGLLLFLTWGWQGIQQKGKENGHRSGSLLFISLSFILEELSF